MMPIRPLALAAAALLTSAAAPAPKAPAKPEAKPAAAAFDARDPKSLVALMAELDAKAEVVGHDEDAVKLKVTSPAGDFEAQYAGCDARQRACKALQFDAAATQSAPSLAQINGFNQSAFACRAYQDQAARPHVVYSALVFERTDRQEMLTHVAAWRGCLASFGAFLKDPPGYLAVAP